MSRKLTLWGVYLVLTCAWMMGWGGSKVHPFRPQDRLFAFAHRFGKKWCNFLYLIQKNGLKMGKRGPLKAGQKRTKERVVVLDKNSLSPTPGMTGGAKTVWRQIVAAFPVGHFSESDRVLLEQFCEAAALHREATALLAKEGRYYTDVRGIVRKRPVCDDQKAARCDCAMLATKLRITKQAMISPKVAGRAVQNAAESAESENSEFAALLYGGGFEMRQ